MEDRLLVHATNWTLQQDDEVRRILEDFRNNVQNTGARLGSNIEHLKEKLLNTDCDIQQLNTQLALLKNAKFVENTVEEEDSRPKPIPISTIFSKEEMVQIVVDAVKGTLRDVSTQLNFEREPLVIESLPFFHEESFWACSLGPTRPSSKANLARRDETSSNFGQYYDTASEEAVIPKLPAHLVSTTTAAIQNGLNNGGYESEESEEEEEYDGVQSYTISAEKVPSPPDMTGFNVSSAAPAPFKLPQPKGLFDSDENEEEEEQELPVAAAVAPKPKDDLMAQLASKLRNREKEAGTIGNSATNGKAEVPTPPIVTQKATTTIATIVTRETAPSKASNAAKQLTSTSEQSTFKGELPIKAEEKPSSDPVISKVSQESDTSMKMDQNVKKTSNEQPKPPKVAVTRKEQPKKKGLFSDSDSSDEDFVALIVKPVLPKSVLKPKKLEAPKGLPKKTTPAVRKSIFDTDSSDDEFTGYFKKSFEKKPAATSSLLQRSARPPSPVKAAPSELPTQKSAQSELDVATKLSSPVSSQPAASSKADLPPAESESHSITDPLNTNNSEKGANNANQLPHHTVAAAAPPLQASAKQGSASPPPVLKTPEPFKKPSYPLEFVSLAEDDNRSPSEPERTAQHSTGLTSTEVADFSTKLEAIEAESSVPKVQQKKETRAKSLTPESRSDSFEPVPPVPELRSDSPPDDIDDRLEEQFLPPLPTGDPLDDSPPPTADMPLPGGKTPGKLNNANFAAMLGSKLQAGPPGMRPPMKPATSTSAEPETLVPSSSKETAAPVSDTTPEANEALCHLTKSRPRRPGVHRPTLHKPSEDQTKSPDPLNSAVNGVAALKVTTSPNSAGKNISPPSTEKNTEAAESTLSGFRSASLKRQDVPSAVQSAKKAEDKPTAAKISTTAVKIGPASTGTAKKGLFDFSSSDEEPSRPTKITKAAATLKTSVTATSSTSVASKKETSTASSTLGASKTVPRNANLAKYKSMFDQEDDLDVSLFKKDKP